MKKIFLMMFSFILITQVVLANWVIIDISWDEYEESIRYLIDKKIIKWYSSLYFKPEKEINRAEFIKIVIKAIWINPDKNIYRDCFKDVTTQWYAKYICYWKSKWIIKGYWDDTYKPYKNINYRESLKIIYASFDYKINKKESWNIELSKYLNNSIKNLEDKKKLNYYITRWEVSELIYTSLLRIDKKYNFTFRYWPYELIELSFSSWDDWWFTYHEKKSKYFNINWEITWPYYIEHPINFYYFISKVKNITNKKDMDIFIEKYYKELKLIIHEKNWKEYIDISWKIYWPYNDIHYKINKDNYWFLYKENWKNYVNINWKLYSFYDISNDYSYSIIEDWDNFWFTRSKKRRKWYWYIEYYLNLNK